METRHRTDLRHQRRDRFVAAAAEGDLRLTASYLLANEPGIEKGLADELSDRHWARVELEVPLPDAASAELLFFVAADTSTRDRPMTIVFNDHALSHRQVEESMLTGGWDRCTIPGSCLRPGVNEVVFRGAGVLHVDRVPGGRSRRSFDGGRNWHGQSLGPERTLDGEYMVRLRVHGHPPAGVTTSDVIDAHDPANVGCIASAASPDAVRLEADCEIPEGCDLRFEMRSGSRPRFDPACWTTWRQATRLERPDRYVQWRAILTTESSARTPVVKSVELIVDGEDAPSPSLQLIDVDQPDLLRSSYAFDCMTPDPRAARFVHEYRLQDIVSGAADELEAFALLRDWSHRQWTKGLARGPYCPTWDPKEILEFTRNDWGSGYCAHYAALMTGASAALGFAARNLIVDHHCLMEIWSETLQKWILEDPYCYYNMTYELDGERLNALDVHELVAAGRGDQVANRIYPDKVEPIRPHLPENFRRFAIPLRNNHLQQASPAEVRHGAGAYHYDGYLWWADREIPRHPEYSLQTRRPADLYWSVNQCRMYLTAGRTAEAVEVDADHVTPNFDHYLRQVDESGWEPSDVPFVWPLHEGTNTLRLRCANAFGRLGRVSQVRIERS